MRRLVLLLAGLLCGAYPLLLWWGVTHDQLLPALSVMGLGCALRLLLTSGSGGAGGHRLLAGIGLLLCLLVGWHQQTRWLLWYPVIVNAFGFVLFCSSLWQPMTLVERIARWREPQLPAAAVAYTRRVTQVWCLFFVANGAGAGWTIWHGDMAIWSLYNGVISYLLMASLMTAEYLLRRRMRARIALGGGDVVEAN